MMVSMGRWWNAKMLAAAMKLPEDQFNELVSAFDRWETVKATAATDPDFSSCLRNEVIPGLLHDATDFIDRIAPGIDSYYICRFDDCKIFAPSTDWYRFKNKYKCTQCGRAYKPWKSSENRLDAA